jgi:hypothetical protein
VKARRWRRDYLILEDLREVQPAAGMLKGRHDGAILAERRHTTTSNLPDLMPPRATSFVVISRLWSRSGRIVITKHPHFLGRGQATVDGDGVSLAWRRTGRGEQHQQHQWSSRCPRRHCSRAQPATSTSTARRCSGRCRRAPTTSLPPRSRPWVVLYRDTADTIWENASVSACRSLRTLEVVFS